MELIEKAYRIQRDAIAFTRGDTALRREKAVWLVRASDWDKLIHQMYAAGLLSLAQCHPPQAEQLNLFGIPVRLTVHDAGDTDDIELMMPPALHVRAPGSGS